MLVTFSTDVGDITMFGNDAIAMLKMMGHSATIPGAILAADIPVALQRLKTTIVTEEVPAPVEDTDENTDEDTPIKISMSRRALPLIELLTTAAKEGCDVMWK